MFYVLGSEETPATPDSITDFRKQLKEYEEKGTPVVTNYSVSIADKDNEGDVSDILSLLCEKVITKEEAREMLGLES